MLEWKRRYLADLVEEFIRLRRLLQGTDAAAHGGGGHSIQGRGRVCSRLTRSTRLLQNRAGVRALTHLLLRSHAPVLPSSLCSDSLRLLLSSRRPEPELAYQHPLMFIKQPPADYSWGVWEERSGVTQEFEMAYEEANSKRFYWSDVFGILT